ncbi:CBO0543 family protein [Heyndrickxia sp. NPDC080065]|uniref:CBO0543 family protein n=1 Tax=Heyndrickxia sp. NPDC080065 TaxID=3390568 RepID=UPI003D054E28
MDKFENLQKVNKLERQAHQLDFEGWLNNELFTWNWWVLATFFIIPWILYIKFAVRSKMIETVLFGALIVITTVLLDEIGVELEFWRYPTQFLPYTPRAIAFDMSMVPVAYMFLYQYFNTWKSFSIALLVMGILFAFIGEPFSVWAELVKYMKWKYIYSFVYYIIAGLSIRWIIIKLKNITQNAK